MKKTLLITLLAVAMAVPAVLYAQTETPSGTVQIGGKVKWLYVYKAQDDDAVGSGAAGQRWGLDGAGAEQFATTNVELDVNGTVGEKVAYVIELQSSVGTGISDAGAGGLGGAASSNDELIGSVVGVRQAKIMISDVIPMTTFTLGTFNLPVSNYQQRATNDYDLIGLPLINMARLGGFAGAGGAIGGLYAPIGLGWQATGVDMALKPMDQIKLDVAYYNGYAGGVPNADVDLEKSWLFNLNIMPVEGANIAVGYMMENWREPPGAHLAEQTANTWVVSGCYQNDKFEINGDWILGNSPDYTLSDKGKLDNLSWTGYQITAGYWVMDALEILGRYEMVDPNTANSKKADNQVFMLTGVNPLSEYDQLSIITAGANYRLADSAEVSVNYLWIGEQGSQIDMNRAVPRVGGKYQKLNNDTLVVQVQVWQ